MDWYLILKFLHVSAAVIWIGGAFVMVMLGNRAARAADDKAIVDIVRQVAWAADRIYVPASIATLLLGLLLAWIGGLWSNLWIILGMLGVAATVGLGILVLTPLTKEVDAAFKTGGTGPAVIATCRKTLTIARVRPGPAVHGHRRHDAEARLVRLAGAGDHGAGAVGGGVLLARPGVATEACHRGIATTREPPRPSARPRRPRRSGISRSRH